MQDPTTCRYSAISRLVEELGAQVKSFITPCVCHFYKNDTIGVLHLFDGLLSTGPESLPLISPLEGPERVHGEKLVSVYGGSISRCRLWQDQGRDADGHKT